jgi:hypothetical protein
LFFCTFCRDADFIFTTLLDYERSCLLNVGTNTTDVARAQATFLAAVVSKFTTEAFHTWRRYVQTTGDTKNLLSLLVKAQRFSDAGIAIGKKALRTEDFREKQGMLSVRCNEHKCPCSIRQAQLTFSVIPNRKHPVSSVSERRRRFKKQRRTIIWSY